jgi:hypothetical protein
VFTSNTLKQLRDRGRTTVKQKLRGTTAEKMKSEKDASNQRLEGLTSTCFTDATSAHV